MIYTEDILYIYLCRYKIVSVLYFKTKVCKILQYKLFVIGEHIFNNYYKPILCI